MRTVVMMAVVLCLLMLMGSVASADRYQIGGSDLIAGRDGPDVGNVIVGWDNVTGELGVLIVVDQGALDGTLTIDATHLYVGTEPPTTSSPGKFPYKHDVPNDVLGAGTDFYDFGTIGSFDDEMIYIAVEVSLTDDLGIDMNDDQVVDSLDYALYSKHGAWANGDLIADTPKGPKPPKDPNAGKGNWSMYFEVSVPEIGTPAPVEN
jgi:hypothetical protein